MVRRNGDSCQLRLDWVKAWDMGGGRSTFWGGGGLNPKLAALVNLGKDLLDMGDGFLGFGILRGGGKMGFLWEARWEASGTV